MTTLEQQVKERRPKWSQGVDPTDTNSVIEYIEYKMLEYEYFDFLDVDLWEQFKADFVDFTEENLKALTLVSTTRKLRILLRNRGILVLINRNVTIAKSISNIIKEEDQSQ